MAVVQYIFTNKQYKEQHNLQKQHTEQHSTRIRNSADRAPSLRGIPWHLPHNSPKSKEKPQSVTVSGVPNWLNCCKMFIVYIQITNLAADSGLRVGKPRTIKFSLLASLGEKGPLIRLSRQKLHSWLTHSRRSNELHAPAALPPRIDSSRYPLHRRLCGPHDRSGHFGKQNISYADRGSEDSLHVQPVAQTLSLTISQGNGVYNCTSLHERENFHLRDEDYERYFNL